MSRTPRVVVVGSSNTDMVIRSPRLPRPGESVVAGQFYMAAGGKGANQAVAAARAGAAVTLIARLGRDVFGDEAIAGFRREGIECRWIARDARAPSGIALILVAEDGENLISVALGANLRLAPAEVERAAPAIARAGALVVQLEVPLPAVRRAVALARRHRVPVVFNPAPAPRAPLPAALLRQIDYLVLNETELEVIAGRSDFTAARGLLDAGVGHVILTRGKQGAAVLDGTPHPKQIPGRKVRAVDAVGAGDAFVGTLAAFIAEGRPLDEALHLANAAAALSVTRKGAQPSMPTRREILSFARRPRP
ncbi:MAG TPA: ribokinase [Planctomycetota bacterium]|nr:ribokinase [Planctomycetota bacterium]HRR79165.1 ribokinase [Planctomycetota bacterium]HRT93964.1 ribokinase [Planctomycetota bacterium]